MKKVHRYFLRSCNAILMAVLALFGFSNCDRMGLDMYGTPTPEYGTPYAKFVIKGEVADKKTEQPIEGIQVKIVGTFTNANGEEQTIYLKPKKLTDEDGSFELRKQHGIGHFLESDALSAAVHFSDIDGEKNGLFENKIVGLNIEDFEETKPPSGWFMGEFTKRLDVKLTPQTDEDEKDKYE